MFRIGIFVLLFVFNHLYADELSIRKELVTHFDFNYIGIFDGPSITNPSRYTPDSDEKNAKRPLQLTNFLMPGYKISKITSIGALINFGYFPVSENQMFRMFDPAIRITNTGFLKNENFSLITDFRVFIPVTEYSIKSQMMTRFQIFQVAEYRFLKTHWTLGSLSSISLGIYRANSSLINSDKSFYFAPNLNYYIKNNFSFSLFAGATLNHYINKNRDYTMIEGTYVGPGANILIEKTLTVSPAIIIPPNDPKLLNASLLLFLTGKFL